MFAKLFSNRTENGFGSRHAVAYRDQVEEKISSQPPTPINREMIEPSLPPLEDATVLQVKKPEKTKPMETKKLQFVEPSLLEDRDGNLFLYKGSTTRKSALYKIEYYTIPNLHRSLTRSEVEIYGEAFFI
jgi:hypothetical protein